MTAWHERPIGMHFHTLAYNAFAISTLSYVAQLEQVPPFALATEMHGLHYAIKVRVCL